MLNLIPLQASLKSLSFYTVTIITKRMGWEDSHSHRLITKIYVQLPKYKYAVGMEISIYFFCYKHMDLSIASRLFKIFNSDGFIILYNRLKNG